MQQKSFEIGCHIKQVKMASKALKRFVPLLDRVLVKKAEVVKQSVGGVLLPDAAVSKVRSL